MFYDKNEWQFTSGSAGALSLRKIKVNHILWDTLSIRQSFKKQAIENEESKVRLSPANQYS